MNLKKPKLEIRFTPLGFKEKGMRKFEFVAGTFPFLKNLSSFQIKYVCEGQQKMYVQLFFSFFDYQKYFFHRSYVCLRGAPNKFLGFSRKDKLSRLLTSYFSFFPRIILNHFINEPPMGAPPPPGGSKCTQCPPPSRRPGPTY